MQFDRAADDRINQPGLIEKIGFGSLVFFTFAVFSSAFDFVKFLALVRPSLIAAVVGLTVVVLSGRGVALLRSKVCIMFLVLTLWDLLCIPFAVWPGGAARTVGGEWLVTLLTVFLTGGLIANQHQFRKLVHVIAYSAILLSFIALGINALSVENRLFLPGSRYSNPNDLATILLTALPFLGFMALRKGNGVRRPLAAVGAVALLLVVARTGSRAAMIGAAVALTGLFFNVGMAQKLKLAIVGMIALFGLIVAVPGHLADRFITIFGDETVYDQGPDADLRAASIASSYSRKMLLMDSIALTFEHPVFGVGPGNFPVAQNELAKARGAIMGDWHVTHNTYTQVSSESGVPGLIMFLAAIFFAFRSITRALRIASRSNSPAGQDLCMLALSLRIAMLAFLSCAFFASLAYLPILTSLCGLAVSLEYCARSLKPATDGPKPATVAPPVSARGQYNLPMNGKRPLRALPRQSPYKA